MMPRAIVYTTGTQPPRAAWNRYGRRIIGAGIRVGYRRLLSIQWRRP